MNKEGVQKALDYIEMLKKTGDYEKRSADIIDFKPRIMKVALLPASAGTGNFIDDKTLMKLKSMIMFLRKHPLVFTLMETAWNRHLRMNSWYG